MSIGSVITARREELGLSQTDLADLLRMEDVKISCQGISKWETGKTCPNAEQFLAVCKVLEIHDVLDEFMGISTSVFAGLNKLGRERVKEYAQVLRESERFSIYQSAPKFVRSLPLYDLPVSAGTGQFLDGENYEMVEVGDEVPMGANFGVRISGDSMEPQFQNGQIVWVRQQLSLMSNEIGIFIYDGDAYIKQLVAEDGEVRLHSLNPMYSDIHVSDTLPLRVLGKVLG